MRAIAFLVGFFLAVAAAFLFLAYRLGVMVFSRIEKTLRKLTPWN